MSHQTIGMSSEQILTPKTGDRSNKGDGVGETLSGDTKGRVHKCASGARTTNATPAQGAQHNAHQHETRPTQSTDHTKPSEGGETKS
eukprot:scaffold6962_cov28-Tisochrysis_lutea.AAC.1